MKKLSEMTDSEFKKFENNAKKQPMSEFAKFHLGLHGYDLFLNGIKIDKWEAFASGYKNADAIINGSSKVTCKKRESKKAKYELQN